MLTKYAQKYRYSLILLRQLIITDFKLRYQGSWLGYVWSLLRPLALFLILYVVFVRFLGIGADIPHFQIYLLLGIVAWSYFAEVTNTSVRMIVERGDLIRKINFPKYVIILASSFSALINFGINLVVVAVFAVFTGVDFRWDIVWMPVLVLELFVLALGAAFLLSALYVKFRDINYIWEVFMQAAFYATPILYPLSFVSEEIGKALLLNPLAQIIQDMRYVFVTDKTTTIGNIQGDELVRFLPVLVVVAIAIAAALYFRKRSKYFAEEV